MKIRYGLVSNSSSSGFIIAYKIKNKCPHCGRSDADLQDVLLEKGFLSTDDTRIHASGKDDVLKHFCVEEWMDPQEAAEIIERIKNVPEDMKIIYCEVSHHDDTTRNLIENMEFNGSGEIIWRGEG